MPEYHDDSNLPKKKDKTGAAADIFSLVPARYPAPIQELIILDDDNTVAP
jgi:hypothetical protein